MKPQPWASLFFSPLFSWILVLILAGGLVSAADHALAGAGGAGGAAGPAGMPRVHQRGASPPPWTGGVTLRPLWVPEPGSRGSFLITHIDRQGLVDRTGVFLLATEEELSQLEAYDVWSVRADYTVLESHGEGGQPRLRVSAWPVDPRTGEALGPVRWEAVYRLSPGGVEQEAGSAVPGDYLRLVEPAWLAEWSFTPAEQLPRDELQPGAGWSADPRWDVEDFPLGRIEAVEPLRGRFVGWEQLEGVPGPAAHVTEELVAASRALQDAWEGVPGEMILQLAAQVDYWLVPGGFPYQAERSLAGDILMTVGPATGAPGHLEGSMRVGFSFYRVVRAVDPD